MGKNLISDSGDLRKYYTQIPNMIDDLELSLIAFRLYVHLKRVTGESGVCWQSSGTLAKACGMSMGAVSKAKLELAVMGLIVITKKKDNVKAYHEIVLVDIWRQNIEKYASLSQGDTSLSPDEILPSLHERLLSPGETKNNPIKDNPVRTTQKTYDEIFAKMDSLIGCPTGGNSDVDTAEIMLNEYGVERFMRAAKWAKEKQFTAMKTALRSMNTALSNGGFKDEKQKDEPKQPAKKAEYRKVEINGESIYEEV